MDNKYFLDESYKYIDELYKDFSALKAKVFDIYLVFEKLCKRNNIPCFAICGTLLGLIRDDGYIPWDYDMDVGVRIKDVFNLISALKKELPNNYYFESNFTNKRYPFYQIRILKKGENPNFIHLDVFYFIGAPDNNIEKFTNKFKKAFMLRCDYFMYANHAKRSLKKLAKIVSIKQKYGFLTIKRANKQFNKMIMKYNYDNANNLMICGINTEIFPKKSLEPIAKLIVNNHEFLVPANVDLFLSCLYKNYKEYLPISNRFNEFYSLTRAYKIEEGLDKEELYRVIGDN